MNRRRFLAKVVAVVGGAAAVESMKKAIAEITGKNGVDAVACSSCAMDFNIYNKCVKCGKEMSPGSYHQARMCTGCGMNNEKRCAYCGKWIYDPVRYYARICNSCYRENACYKCDRGGSAYPDN